MRNRWLLQAGRAVGGHGPAQEELLPVGTCRVHADRNWAPSVPFLSWTLVITHCSPITTSLDAREMKHQWVLKYEVPKRPGIQDLVLPVDNMALNKTHALSGPAISS